MKLTRIGFALVAAALLLLVYGGSQPKAFHSGGVAECSGCHSMHTPDPNGTFLLVGATATATCLSCHEHAGDTGPSSYHISTATADMPAGVAPLQRTPGGDFGWVKKSYTYTGGSESGDLHGHNIVATGYGYSVDANNATSPGGTFPSGQLGCQSCHDPHGQARRLANGTIVNTGQPIKASGSYDAAGNEPTATEAVGVYRLLAGTLYSQAGTGISYPGVPAAKVPSTYNRTEAVTQTRTAYGRSTAGGHAAWGEWCGTCHGDMHSDGNYVHPVDTNLGSDVAINYQNYKKSGDLTGTSATSYSSLVPFVESTDSYATLASHAKIDDSVLTGPSPSDQVSCLSCHRAHASGMLHALRFDMEYEFMTKESNYIGSDNPAVTGSRAPQQHRGRTIAEWRAAYYDRPATQFATYQRVLCNKCHAKD
jgi:predicted CXXCH cytochrome family protein